MPSALPKELAAIDGLPDIAVLPAKQTCAVTNLSIDTLNRLHHRGEGPPRVQLSKKRVGYTVGGIRAWLKDKSSTA